MFCIDLSPTYFAPVGFELLDEQGRLVKQAFDVQFKRMTEAQLDALDVKLKPMKAEEKDAALLAEVVVGWRGIKDASGDLAFSTPALKAVCAQVIGLRAHIATAFFESTRPRAAAYFAEKN